uniref:Uncharacterized protein n=1 Tax=Lepeophtheirus salmonis TaxID=72036 RepID=A0A0K2TUP5_LEPSM
MKSAIYVLLEFIYILSILFFEVNSQNRDSLTDNITGCGYANSFINESRSKCDVCVLYIEQSKSILGLILDTTTRRFSTLGQDLYYFYISKSKTVLVSTGYSFFTEIQNL